VSGLIVESRLVGCLVDVYYADFIITDYGTDQSEVDNQ
jgi:hypothetical protein